MSDKLTEQKIEELIEELLQERSVKVKFPKEDNIDTNAVEISNDGMKKVISQTSKNFKDEFENFISLDGDGLDLTYDDFAIGYKEKDPAFSKIREKGKAAYKNAAERVAQLYDKGIKTDPEMGQINPDYIIDPAKSKSLAFKTMNTISADPEDEEAMGQFPEGIATATKVFLASEDTLAKRFNKINRFIDSVMNSKGNFDEARQLCNNKEAEFLAGVLFCDYISTLVQETDAGAAAYNFEALLAMMSGGRVTGKETVEGGKMGAVDFKTNKGVAGSSKYYASPSSIEQAVGGFKIDEPVYYIIALKKESGGGKTQAATTGGVSDPRLIKELYIFTLVVMYLGWDAKSKEHLFVIKNGAGQIFDASVADKKGDGKNKKIKLGKVREGFLTEPYILKLGTTSDVFQDVIENISSQTISGKGNIIVKTMSDTLASIQDSHQKFQVYASDGNLESGEASLKAMLAAEDGIKKLGTEAFSQTLSEAKDESKLESLDDLIAETIRDIKKKRKK